MRPGVRNLSDPFANPFMPRVRSLVSAVSLVASPLLVLAYWLLYPAYGLLDPGAILRAIDGRAAATTLADVFAFGGTFLAVPASLALMRHLAPGAPRLAMIGGGMLVVGWMALMGLLACDPVAVQIVGHGGPTNAAVDLFKSITNSPLMLALDVLALFHVIGAMLIGVALFQTSLVPRWAAVVAGIAPPIHFSANLAGWLWVDALTWVGLAVAYGCVARLELRPPAG